MEHRQPSTRVFVQPAIKLQDPPFLDDDNMTGSNQTFDFSTRYSSIRVHVIEQRPTGGRWKGETGKGKVGRASFAYYRAPQVERVQTLDF